MNNQKLAEKIVELMGGRENIISAYHCVTRLRFQLKDQKRANLSELKKVEGIIEVRFQSGELQVVIGAGVEKVFAAVTDLLGDIGNTPDKKTKKKISDFIEVIPSIFQPIVPVIAGTGLLKGLLAIISIFKLAPATSETVIILSLISDCVFYFLPFMLAYTCAKKFKTNEILALALAGAYLYPTIVNGAAKGGALHFLGLPIPLISYSATVFPIILSVWLLSYLYRFVQRIMPKVLETVFTSLLVLLIMVPLELVVLGPIGNYIGQGLAKMVQWLFTVSPLLAGGITAALIPIMVFFGMHQALGAIIIQSIASLGHDYILPMFLVSAMAQTGATLGVYLKTKNKEMKSVSQSATVTGLIGITEPALYGCLIKYKEAFAAAMIGGGIGGAFAAAFGARANAYSMPCLLTLPVFSGPSLPYLVIGFTAAFVIPVVIICIRGLRETEKPVHENEPDQTTTFTVYSPVEGELVSIDKVEDATFAQEIIGKGIAVRPTDGTITAPFDGTVIDTFETKHALSLCSNNGMDLLIHMGIDTVRLQGHGFTSKVKSGDTIKRGDVIAAMDLNEITQAGYSTVTPVIVTNTSEYSAITPLKTQGSVTRNEPLFTVSK